jgi:hypothetical protein
VWSRIKIYSQVKYNIQLLYIEMLSTEYHSARPTVNCYRVFLSNNVFYSYKPLCIGLIIMVLKITQVEFPLVISILVAFAVIISFMVFANILVYAQEQLPNIMTSPKKAPVNTTIAPSFPSSSISPPKIHSVKITSPQPGQRVPIGKDLAISGTSIDNANSNNCQVFVIVNSIKPYQPTTPAGASGANDYSKWNFVLSPSKYTSIKSGPNNKITSKYACTDSPTTTSYNSVNVTGIGIGTTPTTTSATAAAPIITTITKKPVSISNNATVAGYSGSRSSGKMSNPGSHVVSITPPSSPVPPIKVKPVFNSNIMPNLNSSELHVKITSPIEGQGISAGKNFTMSGTSSDNSATDCRVYAGLNRLKPYPPAIAAGPGGTADYSKWYFNYSPAYHTATDGNNRLTAKLSCNGNPGLVKYDTMNITGVTTTRKTELPISSPNTPGTTTKVNQLPSTSDNSQSTSSHDPNEIGSGSSSATSNTASTTSDSTDKSIQTHSKIKIRHDIPIKNNKKSNELANNIIKDVKRHLKEGTSIADSGGAAASAGSASAYAGSDGVSVSAGGITLNLP